MPGLNESRQYGQARKVNCRKKEELDSAHADLFSG